MPRASQCVAPLLAAALAGCAGEGSGPPLEAPARGVEVRPDTPGNTLLFHFGASDVVETYGSTGGRILVHFTRQGPNAVPPADADTSGVPDFVEQVASVYEAVLTKYHDELGFRAPVGDQGLPDNGGDGRFDVYLVDFAGKGDGNYGNDVCGPANPEICAGYMNEENDFTGYGYPSTLIANRILGSHEFFHAVQAAYDVNQGSVFAEGTAVWATETFDPSLTDFEGFIGGYLDNPDRPLDTPLPGPVDPFSYGTAIFFKFLDEHYGQDVIRLLWERCEDGANGNANPVWFQELDVLLKQKGSSFADGFTDFATWNLFMGALADPTRSYQDGHGYPQVKMNDGAAPFSKDPLRVYYASSQYYRIPPGGRQAMTAALIAPDGAPVETDGLRLLVTTRQGGTYGPVQPVSDLSAGTQTVDTSGVERFVAIVVNTLQGGPSRRPALCIGTTDEVAACKQAALSQGGSGGGGGAGGGGTGGGAGGSPPVDEGSGCGCRAAGAGSDAAPLGVLSTLALAAYRLRRRRAASASAAA
jgi:MYXO-CTERM domain-containing protein